MSLPKRIIIREYNSDIVHTFKRYQSCTICNKRGSYVASDAKEGTCIRHLKEKYKSFKRLEESMLAPEEKLVYDIMVQHGTSYKTIQQHTTKPLPGIRRVMSQLIIKGFVVRGSSRGFFRIVVMESQQ